MADIDNPEALVFCNEILRPLAEKLRDLDPVVSDIMGRWFAGMNVTIGSSPDDNILDGRESEGVSRLTAADVTNFINQCATIYTQFDGAGVMDIVRKPCVRILQVTEE